MRAGVVLAALTAATAANNDAVRRVRSPQTACTDRESCLKLTSGLTQGRTDSPVLSAIQRGAESLVAARSEAAWAAGVSSTSSPYCDTNAAFDFLPYTVANLTYGASGVSWAGQGCFANLYATVNYLPVSAGGGANVTIQGSNPTSLLCSDVFVFATSYTFTLPVEISTLNSLGSASWSGWVPGEAADVQLNPIRAWILPCGLVGSLESVGNTLNLFITQNNTALEQYNADFLSSRGVWQAPLHPYGGVQMIDASLIRSGDYLAILKLDGLDPLISWGTGFGATGHSALCVWRNGTLYVTEATDANPFGPPGQDPFGPPWGIISHTYDEWVQLAVQASYHVALLPLADQYAAVFDEDAFWAWFDGVQYTPYGYHNFIMAVMDTADPLQSLPQPITTDMLVPILNLADALLGNSSDGVTIRAMLTMPFNQRLGTQCATFACIIAQLNVNKANNVFPSDLAALAGIPEDDSWRYGGNVSFVCSAFAARGWAVAMPGVPAFTATNATEQTPKDNFQLAVYNGTYFNAGNCPTGLRTAIDGGAGGTFCQLMGPYYMPLNSYNTITPYAAMNSACGSQWPDYIRCVDGSANCQC